MVEYDKPIYIDGLLLLRSGADLQILADGTVIVHDPFGKPPGGSKNAPPGFAPEQPLPPNHVKKIVGCLTRKQLQVLLSFLIDAQKVFDFKVGNNAMRKRTEDTDDVSIRVNADRKSVAHSAYAFGMVRMLPPTKTVTSKWPESNNVCFQFAERQSSWRKQGRNSFLAARVGPTTRSTL